MLSTERKWRKEEYDAVIIRTSSSSIVVEHSTTSLDIEGLNPANVEHREKMTGEKI
jgi:hypothetical protein